MNGDAIRPDLETGRGDRDEAEPAGMP
jgi:hypothetical protein